VKKLAIFVEGQTELFFVEKLLLEIGNEKELSIRKESLSGGSTCPVTSTLVGETPESQETKYKILIYSSCNDEKVLSDIKERYAELKSDGYIKIIGLRDLYPIDYSKKNLVRSAIQNDIARHGLDNTDIVLAIMEVETWFVSEITHYSNLHSNLTLDNIRPIVDLCSISNFEQDIPHPAYLLNTIYNLVGYAYRKKAKQVQRTVNKLDYEEIYINLRNKIPGLNEFISHIDDFLT